MTLPIPLGIMDSGSMLVRDLDDMRHLLIIGKTGTGKSVLLKSILRPIENQSCRLVLIDTKGVDFAGYLSSRLMIPVINDVNAAVHFLRDIEHCGNNTVIVIDELSDLIAISPDIQSILIQKAQNSQIHLIMATRKADVLSPDFIKTFSTRISFSGKKIGDAHYLVDATQEQIHLPTVN